MITYRPPFAGLTLALGIMVGLGVPAHAEDSASETEAAAVLLLTDFTDPQSNDRWAVVNDNVMGGRSEGDVSFDADGPGVMVMTGDINTNGGGFASVRMRMDGDLFTSDAATEVLENLRAIRLRVRGDAASLGRPFALRLEDRIRRGRGINFRTLLPIDKDADPNDWQDITIPVTDLQPTFRGFALDPDEWAPLDTSQLARLGLILSDVVDGPYRLEIDRIEFLR
ncbi:MAG: CIA30 family protein [Planctomycetota bacterium]